MQPQVHHPHHFYIAWTLALLATGRATGLETLDRTVWVEADTDNTTFHASNKSCYIRTRIPTIGLGTEWRHIVLDEHGQVKDIASKCKRADPQQQDLTGMGTVFSVNPTPSDDRLAFEFTDDAARSSVRATIPVVDVEWPYEIVGLFDRHETDPTAEMAWPPASAQFIHGVGKFLGVSVPIRLNNLTAAFSLAHPEIPQLLVSGCCATKAS